MAQASLSTGSRSHLLPAVDGPCFADPTPAASVARRQHRTRAARPFAAGMRQSSLQGGIYGVSCSPGPVAAHLRRGWVSGIIILTKLITA